MGLFKQLFSHDQPKDQPGLLLAIERAVSTVEPLLKQTRKYPEAYRKPVMTALEYAHSLANSIPGPVAIDLDAYARDTYVHAIFPSMDLIPEAFRTSRAVQDYLHKNPSSGEIYGLMGMRRREKNTMGMELSGELIQRDVPQRIVYFTSHTIENPAPTEAQAKDQIAWSFFDNLVSKVARQVASRKQQLQSQQQDRDFLLARLHAADTEARRALEEELSRMLAGMQATIRALDLQNFLDDFEAVLLNPEQHLRLDQSTMVLDSMGIMRDGDTQGKAIVFNDLIGYDRRNWTVTLVHCRNLQSVTFAAQLETAYRRLCI